MSTNQEARQTTIRASTSTTHPINGDWHALWGDASVANGTFNERMLAWINARLGTSYTNLAGAMHAYAVDKGFTAWSSMGTFDLGSLSAYAVNDNDPATVADFAGVLNSGTELYKVAGATTTFDSMFDYTGASNKTMTDSSGNLVWAPHNLALNSATPATQSITVISGADYTVEITGTGSVALSGAGSGTVSAGSPVEITASTTTLTLTVSGSPTTMWCYRSDLGGMATNPNTGTTYVPTTSAPVYLPRRNSYRWNGSAYVKKGITIESAAATNLFTYSNDATNADWTNTGSRFTVVTGISGGLLGTYNSITATTTTAHQLYQIGKTISSGSNYCVSVVAKTSTGNPHLILKPYDTVNGNRNAWFDLNSGTIGTVEAGVTAYIEALGDGWYRCAAVASAGSTSGGGVVQMAAADNVITNIATDQLLIAAMQYEAGSVPTSYIPTSATATRAAETLTIAGADMAYSATAMSLHVKGEINYADEGAAAQETFWRWYNGASDFLSLDLDTDSTDTGEVNANQSDTSGGAGTATSDSLSPGVNVAFNIASRHTNTDVNVAVAGTAATADATPTALHDASADTFELGYDFAGTFELFRQWDANLENSGIESAST